MASSPLGHRESVPAKLQDEQMDLCAVGVISGALTHELRNILNNVSLQVAVLRKQLPENFHAGLTVIEEQSAEAAAILRNFQQYRQHRQSPLELLNWNRLIREEFAPESQAGSLQLELAANLPSVHGSRAEMTTLLQLLLDNARRLVSGIGNLLIQTNSSGERVQLQITARGRSLGSDFWQELFGPLSRGDQIVPRLELAGCQQIARHLEGTLRGDNLPGGGLVFVVELPKAEEAK